LDPADRVNSLRTSIEPDHEKRVVDCGASRCIPSELHPDDVPLAIRAHNAAGTHGANACVTGTDSSYDLSGIQQQPSRRERLLENRGVSGKRPDASDLAILAWAGALSTDLARFASAEICDNDTPVVLIRHQDPSVRELPDSGDDGELLVEDCVRWPEAPLQRGLRAQH
jgi:hypothetical protein